MTRFSEAELEAYLDEELPVDQMSRIEAAVRQDQQLITRLAQIHRRRDSGVHSVGEIWRRHRLSCPSRTQLGSYLLDAIDAETANYIFFHVSEVGCRYCQANLADLRQQQAVDQPPSNARQSRYFQSSIGFLRRNN